MGFPDIIGRINQDMAFPFSLERVAMDSGSGGSGQFHCKASFREVHLVVPGTGFLIVMREWQAYGNIFPDERKEKEITEIRTTGTADVGVRETKDGSITIVIARTSVPSPVPGVRAQLDHPERGGGTGICMTMKTGPDKGVRIRDKICLRSSRACR